MLIVCTGTGTDVGKTWVGAGVGRELRSRGVRVAARKPVQSFGPSEEGRTDADILGAATGAPALDVCPPHRWYPVPMAPPMAAAALGLPAFTIAGLVEELRWPSPEPDVRWIESVGGVRSPLADDGDTVDLCRWLEPDVAVLVADAGLGAINAVLLSVAALRPHPVWVLLNRFDPAVDVHRRNAQWLRERGGLDVIWDPIQLADRCVSRLAG